MTTGAPTADGGTTTPAARVPVALGPAAHGSPGTHVRPLRPPLRARRLRDRPGGRPARAARPTRWSARPSPPSSTWPTGAPPAARRTAATAPASSSRCPDDFYRQVVDFALPEPGSLRHRHRLPARRRRRRRPRPGPQVERAGRRGGPRRPRLARRCPVDPATLGSIAEAARPSMHQLFVAPAAGTPLSPGDPALAVDRLAFVLRKRAEHEVDGVLLRLAVGPHGHLQGDAHLPPAGRVLPRPVRRALRQRPGPRPLALLDQHLPVVAAGPPLPVPGPQRRDQHAGRQPELDAGPRGAVRERPHPRASSGSSRS